MVWFGERSAHGAEGWLALDAKRWLLLGPFDTCARAAAAADRFGPGGRVAYGRRRGKADFAPLPDPDAEPGRVDSLVAAPEMPTVLWIDADIVSCGAGAAVFEAFGAENFLHVASVKTGLDYARWLPVCLIVLCVGRAERADLKARLRDVRAHRWGRRRPRVLGLVRHDAFTVDGARAFPVAAPLSARWLWREFQSARARSNVAEAQGPGFLEGLRGGTRGGARSRR